VCSNEIPLIDFLLLGGGLASATAAETLRAAGAEGSIAILCAETILPYHRPPLSKSFLLNGPDQTTILIHDEAFYRNREIDIHLGARVCRVDVDSRTIETDRDHFHFGKLLVATGASVDRLAAPGAHLAGIHYLRTVNDALSLYDSILHARRAVVIGASFIGMELAAALVTRGVATTLIAKEDLVYEKLRSPEVSAFFTEYFRQRNVELIFGEEVKEFSGTTQVEAVVTNSGRAVPCDLVAIGIGVHPEIDFLANSGIEIDDGILVNQQLETNRPGIYAAGDVANFYNPIARARYRAEHWDNAVKQGRIAAWNMLGEQQSWRTVSYFFSDVFDFTSGLQHTAGPYKWVIRVRVRPAAAPAMSVMPRKRRSAIKMRSVAMGQNRTRALQQRPSHSITSPVRRNDNGTPIPSPLAVLSLMYNLTFASAAPFQGRWVASWHRRDFRQ
jgi:NADPH-dependent 2,4-dienoyl-CoA reductase/sulfur reductase-like enzyme